MTCDRCHTSTQEHSAVVLHAVSDHELFGHDNIFLAELADESIRSVDERCLLVYSALEFSPVVIELCRGPQVEGVLVVELDHVQVEQVEIGMIACVLLDVFEDGAVLLTHHQHASILTARR